MSAYWISPEGKVFEVDSRHIRSIIADPRAFGLTADRIKAVYKKHGEGVGLEGDAREEIMVLLMNRGWIRIRYIPQQYVVTVQLSDVFYRGGEHAGLVTMWAEWALKKKEVPEFVSVNILNLKGDYVMPSGHELYAVASGALYERRKKGTFAEFLNPRRNRSRRGRGRS